MSQPRRLPGVLENAGGFRTNRGGVFGAHAKEIEGGIFAGGYFPRGVFSQGGIFPGGWITVLREGERGELVALAIDDPQGSGPRSSMGLPPLLTPGLSL